MGDEYTVNKPSKIFFAIALLITVGSLSYGYYRFIYALNYGVDISVPCDPNTHTCFVSVCDPNTEVCTGDPKEDRTYYATLRTMAHNVPTCDSNDEACRELYVCHDGDSSDECEVLYCNVNTLIEGERCNDASDIVTEEEAIDSIKPAVSPTDEAGEAVSLP